ncbi:AfsR/SARP family transcriptional regulator [Amycolatopsis sp. H20-H5]|uniref:AfsR/SARP family transcriptional regulator n=1 Tax=Amycolatopsis sp. H20-H5 TaxID=3046309 RepID=UPI002DBA0D8A|nr:BTAD domain-containing putative transcriptional regulator [Amycolatopsis sp. H20-H5]MEC3976153.1 BTAD domain-containing putative transcriptional regulator [Amycolatopsis sp. H20-H5]
MEFLLLGPVEVRSGTVHLQLASQRQRALLAALLLTPNVVVPPPRLMEVIWGETAPTSAPANLRNHVSQLRQRLATLEDGAQRISARAGGYLIEVQPEEVDVARFDRLAESGHQALRTGDDKHAAELLGQALALWRGRPLANLPATAVTESEAQRLIDARLSVVENHGRARLNLGACTAVAGELRRLVVDHPFHERLWALLMLALAGAGQQAAALDAYDAIRGRLAADLGADPGPDLREAQLAVLRQQTTPSASSATPPAETTTPTRGGAVGSAESSGRNCLPRDLADFTGRDSELARLVASADDCASVYTVDGMAGVGKTAFAVHTGHLLAERFRDGVLFVDLQGHSAGKVPLTADEALDVLLGQLGIATIGDAKAQWRAKTAALRLLVIFDNAVDEAQVAPLVPAGPGLVIVTSRARLPNLAGARPLSLAVLAAEEAAVFFARLVGTDRAAAEPEAVAHIVRLCAGLPLALRLSGARLAHRTAWPIAHLSAQLADARWRLPKLFADREVALAFRMSHEQLPPGDQQVFYALGRHPGADADTAVLAAMTGLPVERADDALQRLVDVHLAEEPVPGRYRQHDLLRQYARGLSDDPQMTEKLLDHYLRAITDAAAHLDGNGQEAAAARAWLMAERSNLLAATHCAAAEGYSNHAWRLAISFWHFLGRNLAGDPIELLEQSLAAAQETAEGGEGLLNTLLALAHWSAGHTSRTYDLLTASAKQQDNNTESHAHTLALLGLIHLQRGAHARAAHHAQAAFDELAELTQLSPLGIDAKIITFWTRGVVLGLNGEHDTALVSLRTAYAACEELGRQSPNDHVLTALARCLIALGAAEEALGHLRQARELRQRIGDKEGEAETLVLIGTAQRSAGHPHDALEPQRAAVTMLDNDARLQAHARIELGQTLAALGSDTEAIGHYELALTLAVHGDHLHEQAQAHHELALTGNDPQTARKHQRAAAEIATRLDLEHPKSLPHLRPAGW